MNSVMLKAKGVKQISRNEMLSFSVPSATDSYCPISNAEIIETALENFDKNGFKVKSEFNKCDGSMQKFVGGFVISGGNSEADLMFGWKNSYDYSMSAAYALGAQIIVCSNSVVRGDQSLIRKHTGTANRVISYGISEGIKRLGDNFQKLEKELQIMKEIEITKTIAASLIGRLYLEEEIITSHQLSILKKEFNHESFDYGVKGSMFNLYQAVTHSLKTSHPTQFLNSHLDAHTFFTNATGILVENKPLIVFPSEEERIAANQLDLFNESIMI